MKFVYSNTYVLLVFYLTGIVCDIRFNSRLLELS